MRWPLPGWYVSWRHEPVTPAHIPTARATRRSDTVRPARHTAPVTAPTAVESARSLEEGVRPGRWRRAALIGIGIFVAFVVDGYLSAASGRSYGWWAESAVLHLVAAWFAARSARSIPAAVAWAAGAALLALLGQTLGEWLGLEYGWRADPLDELWFGEGSGTSSSVGYAVDLQAIAIWTALLALPWAPIAWWRAKRGAVADAFAAAAVATCALGLAAACWRGDWDRPAALVAGAVALGALGIERDALRRHPLAALLAAALVAGAALALYGVPSGGRAPIAGLARPSSAWPAPRVAQAEACPSAPPLRDDRQHVARAVVVVGELDAIAAAAFGGVEGLVGGADQIVVIEGGGGGEGDPDRGGHVQAGRPA